MSNLRTDQSLRFGELGEERLDARSRSGWRKVGAISAQGNEHEGPSGQLRMGQPEVVLRDPLSVLSEQSRSRSSVRGPSERSAASELFLDAYQCPGEPRALRRCAARGRVQVVGCGGPSGVSR